MTVTLAPPRVTKSVARTADGRELIHFDFTPHDGRVRTDPRVRPHYLAAPAPMGAFVDNITAGVAAQRPPRDAATETPGPTAAVTR